MSTQSDAKKATLQSDVWRERSATKRSRVRPFLIEWRYAGDSRWMRRRYGEWSKWSAYETKRQRDHALEQKRKSERVSFEYRAVDR